MRKTHPFFASVVVTLAVFSQPLDAEMMFEAIHQDTQREIIVGDDQISLNVERASNGRVRFEITNDGPADGAVTNIYFDDALKILGNAYMEETPLVQFMEPPMTWSEHLSAPLELGLGGAPAPDEFDFVPDRGFFAHGRELQLDAGETAGIVFDLRGDLSLGQVMDGLEDGALRLAVVVQNAQNGAAQVLLNELPGSGAHTPEPATWALTLIGLGGAAVVSRRRRRKA